MVKIQVNSQGKAYYTSAGKVLLAPETGNTIIATNNTGSVISSGDKVWIEPSGNNYNLINFRSAYGDFTIVGSPSFDTSTGVVSGFSSSNYLTLPQSLNPANSSWEVKLKFTTSNSITGGLFQTITSYSQNGRFGICLLIVDGGRLDFAVSSDGSSWMFDRATYFTLTINTTYWVKFGWTGTTYYLDYSTDGTNYIRDITENRTTLAYSSSNYTLLGLYSTNSKDGFSGTVDLSDCYIKVNNSIWWGPEGIQVTEDTLTGFAQENIASGSIGNVKTVLGD